MNFNDEPKKLIGSDASSVNIRNGTTSDICARESRQLRAYLNSLSRPDHRLFISDVIKKAGVERKIFYNWKYGNSRMPSYAKAIIQQFAGKSIFAKACDETVTSYTPPLYRTP